MDADPNDPAVAFAEYADDSGKSSAWAQIGALGMAASVATTAALQAVDGVALRVMIDRP